VLATAAVGAALAAAVVVVLDQRDQPAGEAAAGDREEGDGECACHGRHARRHDPAPESAKRTINRTRPGLDDGMTRG
jgi:hypothetical protein